MQGLARSQSSDTTTLFDQMPWAKALNTTLGWIHPIYQRHEFIFLDEWVLNVIQD